MKLRRFELLCLIALVAGIYGTRMSSPSLRGEESRRARAAAEILTTGDWVVPRQQGRPYFGRPPLQNWMIALLARESGGLNPLTIRLPSVLAVLLTSLLVYGYGCALIGRLGGFAAASGFATMVQVMETGRLAETEAVFTLFVSAALLLWHLGYVRGWRPVAVWIAGYGCAALGALTKGLQAPIYFAGTVGLFLLIQRQWRYALSWAHLAGLAAFAALLAPWQILFARELGWTGVQRIWLQEVGLRFVGASVGRIAGHIVSFPVEVFACMLPWSLLLGCALMPSFRENLGDARRHVRFLLLGASLALVSCWIPPGARTRYVIPVYPLLATVVGVVVHRAATATSDAWAVWVWTRFAQVMAGVMVLCGGGVAAASLAGTPAALAAAQPPAFVLVYSLAASAAGVALWFVLRRAHGRPSYLQVVIVGAFLGATYTGVEVNALIHESIDTEGAVAQLRQRLPRNHHLVSLGPVHHLFAYYYREPITQLDWHSEIATRELEEPGTFFCFERSADFAIEPDFPWQEVAVISVARSRQRASTMQVVVGRLIPRDVGGGP